MILMSCFIFSNTEDKQQNPMVQLFYGTFVTERKHEGEFCQIFRHCDDQRVFCSQSLRSVWLCLGKTLCNIEQFGQYPLQVNGFNNLDECLEGAMVEKEIESLHSDHSTTSGREVNCFINWLIRNTFFLYAVFSAWCFTNHIFSWFQRWFKKLPPVLTFELSRFEFNTQLGRPEKIHKKLEFPQIIYMDRWALFRQHNHNHRHASSLSVPTRKKKLPV